MNPELEARATLLTILTAALKDDPQHALALKELGDQLVVLMARWRQEQTTVIDEAGNITIGLRPLSMRARPVDMR